MPSLPRTMKPGPPPPPRGWTRPSLLRAVLACVFGALALSALFSSWRLGAIPARRAATRLLPQQPQAQQPPPGAAGAEPDWRACAGQPACCAAALSPAARPHAVVGAGGAGGSWRMAVHASGDIVSGAIRGGGQWDAGKTAAIRGALGAPADGAVLLDVGANVGWHTLAAAYAGFHVVAAEPFAENVALLRHSLCLAPPDVRARVRLLPVALGHRDGLRCELWQVAAVNRGDTHTICQADSAAPEVARMRAAGYRKLGEATMRRLDSLIAEGAAALPAGKKVVMKIDVEGFEPFAMQGAAGFLRDTPPAVVFSEFAPSMIRAAAGAVGESAEQARARPEKYLAQMKAAGYSHTLPPTGTTGFGDQIFEAVFTYAKPVPVAVDPAPAAPVAMKKAAIAADWRACERDAACCARLLSPPARPHKVVRARVGAGASQLRWQMATHGDSDLVSSAVQASGAWEPERTAEILGELAAAARTASGGAATFVDVGANIGWFTLAAAYAGFRVVAVEPFAENVALLRHSLCLAPPDVRARVRLLPVALGHRDGMTCELWQVASFNRGDTHTICQGSSAAPAIKRMRASGYRKLGEAHMRRMDSLVADGSAAFAGGAAVVMKIDVEGFEPMAMQGAKGFIANVRPVKIYSEFCRGMMRSAAQAVGDSVEESNKRPQQYLDQLASAGYTVPTAIGEGNFNIVLTLRKSPPQTAISDIVPAKNWRDCNGAADCCARLLSPKDRPHKVVTAKLRMPDKTEYSWPMAIHPDSDIVSQSIAAVGTWDGGKSLEMLAALKAAGPTAALLDVGANVGWFTLAMAAAGRKVIAVEPFSENLAMINHSLCLGSAEMRKRIQIFPTALGNKDGMKCEMWTATKENRGDTHTVCDYGGASTSLAKMRRDGYTKLGEAGLKRLDTMIATNEVSFSDFGAVVMKIDVEGFEGVAMEGMPQFLAKVKPTVIYSEYSPKMIIRAAQSMGASVSASQDGPQRFLDYMMRAGYAHELRGGGVHPVWGLIQEVVFTPLKVPQASLENKKTEEVKDWRECGGNAACCKRLLSPARRPHKVVTAKLRMPDKTVFSWPMAIHPDSDIVSQSIEYSGTWDGGKTIEMLTALKAAGPTSALLDVGANVGWFTLAMAAAGRKVIAVEPFTENLAMMNHSLCLGSAAMRERIEIFPTALGNKDGMKCEMWTATQENRGDTHTVCDFAGESASAVKMRRDGFTKLGEAGLKRLDTMVSRGEVSFSGFGGVVMKIDVEGFEYVALQGASGFLARTRPTVIFSEYSPKMIQRAAQSMGATAAAAQKAPREFLEFMGKSRYNHELRGGGNHHVWGLIQEVLFTPKQ